MKISQIKGQLVHGDVKILTLVTGISASYIRKILNGKRDVKSLKAQKVIRAARQMIRDRENLKDQMEANESALNS